VWSLHASNCYNVSSIYSYLTYVNENNQWNDIQFLWLKAVPLKVSIFAWGLFLNRVPTKDKLVQMRVYPIMTKVALWFVVPMRPEITCLLIVLFLMVCGRLLLVGSVFHGSLVNHLHQFGGLRGFTNKTQLSLNIIWLSAVRVIWKERNKQIFQRRGYKR